MRTTTPNALTKTFTFPDFPSAMAWMLRCSYEAEKMNHHPDRRNIYNTVQVTLTTHDAGDTVTDKDRALAVKMDAYYQDSTNSL